MKRPKRAIRIVKRKAEPGNPKDFDELTILPLIPGINNKVIALIGDHIIYNGNIIKMGENKNEKKKRST